MKVWHPMGIRGFGKHVFVALGSLIARRVSTNTRPVFAQIRPCFSTLAGLHTSGPVFHKPGLINIHGKSGRALAETSRKFCGNTVETAKTPRKIAETLSVIWLWQLGRFLAFLLFDRHCSTKNTHPLVTCPHKLQRHPRLKHNCFPYRTQVSGIVWDTRSLLQVPSSTPPQVP